MREDGYGCLPPMVSCAQNFEDVILRRALQDIEQGFYIDIGAWHPVHDSVTAWFYDLGWHGINVEPNPQYFGDLERVRTRDINLQCVVGATGGTCLFTIFENTGLSSGVLGNVEIAESEIPAPHRVIQVPSITLDQLFALSGNKTLDFLKIDAEGMEDDILNSAAFRRRPRVIVVESTRPNTQLPCHQRWEPQLLAKDYEFVLFDGLNRFYVSREEAWRRALFAVPPCVFDNFMVPTLQARLNPVEEALALSREERRACDQREAVLREELQDAAQREATAVAASEEERRASHQREAVLREELQDATQREATLAAAVAASDEERRASDQREAVLREELQHVEQRKATLAAAVAASEEERRARSQREAILREELQDAAQRETTLRAAWQHVREEAEAWQQARTWLPENVKIPLLLRFPPTRIMYWKFILRKARAAARRRDWAGAVKCYQLLLSVEPNLQPAVWVQYGHACKERGALAEAAIAYRRGLLLYPNHPDGERHLSRVIEVLRNTATSAADSPLDSSNIKLHRQPPPINYLSISGHALAEDDPLVRRTLILRDLAVAFPARLG